MVECNLREQDVVFFKCFILSYFSHLTYAEKKVIVSPQQKWKGYWSKFIPKQISTILILQVFSNLIDACQNLRQDDYQTELNGKDRS